MTLKYCSADPTTKKVKEDLDLIKLQSWKCVKSIMSLLRVADWDRLELHLSLHSTHDQSKTGTETPLHHWYVLTSYN